MVGERETIESFCAVGIVSVMQDEKVLKTFFLYNNMHIVNIILYFYKFVKERFHVMFIFYHNKINLPQITHRKTKQKIRKKLSF